MLKYMMMVAGLTFKIFSYGFQLTKLFFIKQIKIV